MSAYREFIEAQQLLNTLFITGHRVSRANVDYLINQLEQRANRMVSLIRQDEEQRVNDMPRLQEPTSPATLRQIREPAPRVVTPPPRRNPLVKSKVVAKKKLEEPCPEVCTICQEIPKHNDAICTECNHYYCKSCWSSWMNAERSNKNCPTCRKYMPKITTFKARATKRLTAPINTPISSYIVIEDDN